ncbi:hypothetical protein [Fibrella arboris]|uniref:hypothetical protein n=1 Tax=Fibrella arboris TaxID=3242486 RepID=UPI00351FE81D
MPRSAVVSIPLPCTESWEQMTSVTGGRHCAACQKTVQDFSAFSDRELANWLATYTGEAACGRFRTDQLERSIQPVQVRSEQAGYMAWVRWAMALVLGWQTARAQPAPSKPTSLPTAASPIQPRNTVTLSDPVLFCITGRIVNEDSIPYNQAIVGPEGGGRFVTTNEQGEFNLPIYASDHVQDTIRLRLIGDGSRMTIKVAAKQPKEPLSITMYATFEQRTIVGGGFTVVQQETPKRRSFWQFLTGKR